ncbi:hypothetical protein TELCIR_19919 [Teladorsagia circumcincta]|uniref:Proteasome activator Blm10 middle HEAT repeats region domain-containing protein n=1 Tax=Teladorsagia circumcincta TaxID=45464 RepID=A0A2G9TKZ6_TELCI|nr:hypothetical protein TELCIR_19919 [Teladorsagia circumcincta]
MTEFKTCNMVDAFPGNSFVDSIAFGKLSLKSAKEEESEDDGDDNDMDIGSNSSCVRWYQKEIWQLTKLPYYEDLERQANKTLASIKAGLSHAILLNDPITGLMHWVPELERVYPALETLTEPHRLLQALQVLVAVAPVLAKDQPDKNGKTFRVHAINLMNSLLPGLDQNDMGKCLTTFQIVGVLVNLIPLVDCSDAVHLRSDLSEDEKELCSATANFDSIIAMFMDKLVFLGITG